MTDFILPDIGEGIVECELLKWLVNEGDTISEDQAVAEVMTDKATVEIPAMYDGVVKKLYYKEGEIAKVHSPLFAMSRVDEGPDSVAEDFVDNTTRDQQRSEAFLLPDIGEGIVECEIVKWSVAEGDTVEEDQVVVEVMTDKAVVEIPAKYPGSISKLHYREGDIAKVHSVLFEQLVGEDINADAESNQDAVSEDIVVENLQSSSSSSPLHASKTSSNHPINKQGENFEAPVVSTRALASPAVRRLARELGVTIEGIKGSGKKGRVLKSDVAAFQQGNEVTKHELSANIQASNKARSDAISAVPSATKEILSHGLTKADRVEPVRGIRAAMAKHMHESVSTIPHFSVSDELAMNELITLRGRLKPEFEKQGVKLSFMPFFIKALSLALNEFPILNSRLNENADELTYIGAHNIGMAVDSTVGLLVPNIKHVEQLSLKEVALEVDRITKLARDGKLSNADLSGGSISISNIGTLGGISATPVINKPEVAIVALGKTQKLPRFSEDGSVVAEHLMMVNWSGDHRVIDGATMVKFNNLWMEYLSKPEKMMLNLR